jgi:hypothetical protein
VNRRVFISELTSVSAPYIMVQMGKWRDGHEDPSTDVLQILFKIVFWICGHSIRAHAVEKIMKSRTKNGAENNLHKVKDKPDKRLQKPMKDPTLEGRDENKVGRIPEKSASVD